MFQALDLYNGVARQVAQKEGVLLIDLARELPRTSASYYDFLHYTESGAAAAAGILDRHLAPWLARRFPSFKKPTTPRGQPKKGRPGESLPKDSPAVPLQ
jgi:hypothetical protein